MKPNGPIQPLGLRVRHKEGEGAYSLGLRLAHRLGYARFSHFAARVGLPTEPGMVAAEVRRVSALSGVPLERLEQWTIARDDDYRRFGLAKVARRLVRQRPRICPECLAEDRARPAPGERAEDACYLREHWRFIFIQGCGRHGRELLSRCPACAEQLHFEDCPLWRCPCGVDLTGVVTPRLSIAEGEFLKWTLGRLGVGPPTQLLAGLADVDLGHSLDLLRCLGLSAMGGRDRAAVPSAPLIEGLPAVLIAGSEALSDLPGSFERFLDGIAVIEDDRQLGANGIYGQKFVGWFRRSKALPEILNPIFEAHLAERNRHIRYKDRTGWLPPQSLRREKRRERLTPEQHERLERATGWPPGGERPRRTDVIAALRPKGEILVGRLAADRLNLYLKTFDALVKRGRIAAAWGPFHSTPTYFYRADLDEWLRRLLDGAREVDVRPDGYFTIEESTHLTRQSAHSLIERLLMEGPGIALKWTAGTGARAVLLPRMWLGRPRSLVPDGALGMAQAEEALMLSDDALRSLRDDGLIPMEKVGGVNYVLPEDISAFRAKFVSHSELAKLAKMSCRALRARVTALNLAPLRGDYYSVYERAEAIAALAA